MSSHVHFGGTWELQSHTVSQSQTESHVQSGWQPQSGEQEETLVANAPNCDILTAVEMKLTFGVTIRTCGSFLKVMIFLLINFEFKT